MLLRKLFVQMLFSFKSCFDISGYSVIYIISVCYIGTRNVNISRIYVM